MNSETTPATSNICDKSDDTEITHYQHVDQSAKRHVCDLCHREFSVRKYLKRHLLTHAPKENKNACYLCNKVYSRKDALKRHILTHTEERPHVCNMCNEAFSRKDELSKHFLTHKSVGNLHTCYKCFKPFSREDALKRHLLTHTGDKPHGCSQCPRRFSRRDELIKHFLTHKYPRRGAEGNTNEEQQPCEEFFIEENLKTRLIIHIRRRKPLKFAKQTVATKP